LRIREDPLNANLILIPEMKDMTTISEAVAAAKAKVELRNTTNGKNVPYKDVKRVYEAIRAEYPELTVSEYRWAVSGILESEYKGNTEREEQLKYSNKNNNLYRYVYGMVNRD
jgi:hypothetical protein